MRNKGNVVVDIGNSKIKTAIFHEGQLTSKFVTNNLSEVRTHYGDNHSWIISSVRKDTEQITEIFQGSDHLILNRSTPLPISLNYDTPETLGMDRIAAAVGAYHLYNNTTALVIDAGTCITYDVIDQNGAYQGGVISPGLVMRMKAMGHFTRQLPDISSDWEKISYSPIGKSTHGCLLKGAFDGVIYEMDGFITHFLKEYGDLSVILTGGDAHHFESKLKAPIFADFDLVLTGLNRILNHNK